MSGLPISLNSPQYVISDLTSASQQITIESNYQNRFSRILVDNSLSTTPAFVVSGTTSQTAVYPTSNTAALLGAVVGGGSIQSFAFDPSHKFVAAIRETGTADLAIKFGTGV